MRPHSPLFGGGFFCRALARFIWIPPYMAEGMRFLLFCVDTREESFKGVVAEPTILTATQSVTAHLSGSLLLPPPGNSPMAPPHCRPPFPRKSIRTGRTRPHAIRNPHLHVNAKAHLPDRIVLPPTRQQPRGGPNMARPSTSRRINYIAVRAAVPGDPYNVNLRSSLSVVGAASLGGPPTSQAPPTPGTPAPRRRNSERWRYRRSLWYPHSRTCRCCRHGASAPSRKRRSLCCRFCI